MRTTLTIAGSDTIGGAGIQADIKTMTANGTYAMSAITALTAQNTTGVYDIFEVPAEFLIKELDCIFTDIFPDAVKVGMVSSEKLIQVIAERLKHYKAKNIVIDPVMVSTSGDHLIEKDALDALKTLLFPLATIITPNIPEAEILSDRSIKSSEDMIAAAEIINTKHRTAVLLKGGHQLNDANDLLYANGQHKWFCGMRITTANTHGTGCTLSSAIASNLAKGFPLTDAVQKAKTYISGALSANLNLGQGSGPMDHGFDLKPDYKK